MSTFKRSLLAPEAFSIEAELARSGEEGKPKAPPSKGIAAEEVARLLVQATRGVVAGERAEAAEERLLEVALAALDLGDEAELIEGANALIAEAPGKVRELVEEWAEVDPDSAWWWLAQAEEEADRQAETARWFREAAEAEAAKARQETNVAVAKRRYEAWAKRPEVAEQFAELVAAEPTYLLRPLAEGEPEEVAKIIDGYGRGAAELARAERVASFKQSFRDEPVGLSDDFADLPPVEPEPNLLAQVKAPLTRAERHERLRAQVVAGDASGKDPLQPLREELDRAREASAKAAQEEDR